MKPLNLFKPLPLAAMISLFAAGQAHAFTPGVSCYGSDTSSTCELRIANNLSLQTTVGHLLDKYNGEYQLSGTVMIVSGAARFPMQEADIVVNLTAQPEVYGTAVIPFDKMSGMEKATFETLPRVVVGLVQGDNIETLIGKDIPLNDDVSESGSHRGEGQPYFVFHADAGLAMSYDFGKDAEILNNFVFTMPGSVSATAIFDAADPYIYWSYDKTEGIDLNGLKKNEQYGSTEYDLYDDQGNLMMRYTQVDNGELYEQNFVTGEMFIYTRDSDGNYVMDGSDPANPVVLDGRQFDGSNGRRIERTTDSNPEEQKGSGADIGAFGVSLHGWIPFEAQSAEGLPADAGEFSGQLALSGTIPMGGGVNLEGDVITYIGEHGFAQGGNGDVSWGLPFVPDFISFDIELGAASAVLKVTDYEQMTYVSGEVKPDSAFLQDLLPIMPQAGAKVQGYIGNQLQETFIAIEGAMGMGADTFGDWIGVDLNDLSLTSASMRVTADGFTV
ncbi:MAG: hypothetical protein EP315_06465, partial [Gammaproteobacteria bacterium]